MPNGFDLLMRCQRLEDARLSLADKAVLCGIASFFNEQKGFAFPSLKQLQARICCGDRHTLIRAIRRLSDFGLLSVTQRKGAGNQYRVLPGSVETNTSAETNTSVEINTGGSVEINTRGGVETNTQNTNRKTKEIQSISTSSVEDVDTASPDFVLSGDESPAHRKNGIPPCPAQKMVEAFNRRIPPAMPRVLSISPARQQAMSARWRFIWTDCKCLTVEDALDEWDGFLTRVSRSDFLMNRTERKFRGGLDFLVTQRGFLGVIEGKYDNNR